MARMINWEDRIGRRLRLRDLHVLFAVLQRGSMAKAAAQLGISQPTISGVIANLEHTVGVRLLDRGPRGVEPTIYAQALLRRGLVAFDELKQGIRDIEFLTDPTAGEIRIGCSESLAAAILPPIIDRFSQKHPRVLLHVAQVDTPTLDFPGLRQRNFDFVLARVVTPLSDSRSEDELDIEVLFNDKLVLAVGKRSRFAKFSKVSLAELANEKWILTPPGTLNTLLVTEAFRRSGLDMPKISVATFSVHLRTHLLATGRFVTAVPNSVVRLNADSFTLKVLPVDLPVQPWPVAIVSLKNRTLSPVVQLFLDEIRAFTAPLARKQQA
jgi:DNA-binding transcriptional LysR family regulator